MNNVFLMWRWLPGHSRAALRPDEVSSRLLKVFGSVYASPPPSTIREERYGSAVFLEPGIEDWRPAFAEADPTGWIHAVDYPMDVPVALEEAGLAPRREGPLLALRRGLQEDGENLLVHLAPPFSVVWSEPVDGSLRVQNDALGQTQLFEYHDDKVWILTNRVASLEALDVKLEPVALEWAARSALGWFPLFTTGFRNVAKLPGGTLIVLDESGVHHERSSALKRWLAPPRLTADEWLETVLTGMLKRIGAAADMWGRPWAGLSGGWDSRAVVACLRRAGVDFRARVKGGEGADDVVIAKELARLAGFDLLHERASEQPAPDAAGTAESISRMVLWQAGQTDTEKHKTAFVGDSRIDRGGINIMGQHGELARGTQYEPGIEACRTQGIPISAKVGKIIAERVPFHWFERRPHALRQDLYGPVRELIEAAFEQESSRFGLEGFELLDFFYLHEITRCRSAGSLNGQESLVFAPFLQPAMIQAVFADNGIASHLGSYHRYLIKRCAPDWEGVRFTPKGDYPVPEEVEKAQSPNGVEREFYEKRGSRYYDAGAFWKGPGRPLIDEALVNGGFWTEVLDEATVRAAPIDAPDELTMLYEVERALL